MDAGDQQRNYPTLNAKIKAWREGANKQGRKITLFEIRDTMGISVGYMSDIETGKAEVTKSIFRKFHTADPDFFPLSDAGLMI